MGRFGDSKRDLVGALLFLLNNDAAGFITGICLPRGRRLLRLFGRVRPTQQKLPHPSVFPGCGSFLLLLVRQQHCQNSLLDVEAVFRFREDLVGVGLEDGSGDLLSPR